jgi:hypothetical protein
MIIPSTSGKTPASVISQHINYAVTKHKTPSLLYISGKQWLFLAL